MSGVKNEGMLKRYDVSGVLICKISDDNVSQNYRQHVNWPSAIVWSALSVCLSVI